MPDAEAALPCFDITVNNLLAIENSRPQLRSSCTSRETNCQPRSCCLSFKPQNECTDSAGQKDTVLRTRRLVSGYLTAEPLLRKLLVVIKTWATERGINDRSQGWRLRKEGRSRSGSFCLQLSRNTFLFRDHADGSARASKERNVLC